MARYLLYLIAVFFFNIQSTAKADEQNLLAQVLAYHFKHADCDQKVDKLTSADLMTLNKNTKIVMVLCIQGAYQGSSVFYMAEGSEAAPFIWTQNFATTNDGKKFTGTDALTNASFDRENKSITSFYKSRGIGDCGASSEYKWSGTGFYLRQASYMPCCTRADEKRENPQCKKFLKLRDKADGEFPAIFKYKK